jgi:hypothetical protein
MVGSRLGSPITANTDQSGLCDTSTTADHIAAPIVLSVQNRPRKRPFADIEENAGDETNSDELYGWIEDDEVAAEGLLIAVTPVADNGNNAGSQSAECSNNMIRPSTL